MGNGVTVIFGTVRTTAAPSEAAGLSGPPAGAWSSASARRRRRRGKPRSLGPEPKDKPVFEQTCKGRDFERRIRTFVR